MTNDRKKIDGYFWCYFGVVLKRREREREREKKGGKKGWMIMEKKKEEEKESVSGLTLLR